MCIRDRGVAFEQGKLLPTPETIPFRLTRDLVDGMGIMGIEGVFRCACAKTMQVIRNSKESISTIVEVNNLIPILKYFYRVAMTPKNFLEITGNYRFT